MSGTVRPVGVPLATLAPSVGRGSKAAPLPLRRLIVRRNVPLRRLSDANVGVQHSVRNALAPQPSARS
jgi:hypothetical protein